MIVFVLVSYVRAGVYVRFPDMMYVQATSCMYGVGRCMYVAFFTMRMSARDREDLAEKAKRWGVTSTELVLVGLDALPYGPPPERVPLSPEKVAHVLEMKSAPDPICVPVEGAFVERAKVDGEAEAAVVELSEQFERDLAEAKAVKARELQAAIRKIEGKSTVPSKTPAGPCAHPKLRVINGGARFCDACQTVVPRA